MIKTIAKNGLLDENPIFRQVLGMCPTLAVTTAAINGVGMGLATTFVLIASSTAISLLRGVIPAKVRIPAFVVIITTFATVAELIIKAFIPSLYDALGIFLPLIAVNCIILARAESFAYKNAPLASAFDGLSMGIGFTLAITLLASVREMLGSGTLFGYAVIGAVFPPMLIAVLPPGGFFLLGFLLIAVNKLLARRKA